MPDTVSASAAPGAAAGARARAKRAVIARAALDLFVRDGYERTSVDAIAAEAGVSKRTVYNHYGDKERLFVSVVADTYEMLMDQVTAISRRTLTADPALDGPDGVAQALLEFISGVAVVIARSPERAALLRVIFTEAAHIPALREVWASRRSLTPLLAEWLAAIGGPGGLRITDPVEAGGHLAALTFGQINTRSLFGIDQLSDAEIDDIVRSGVAAFVRAYRRD
jgi:AcrR family transcriptional regulator